MNRASNKLLFGLTLLVFICWTTPLWAVESFGDLEITMDVVDEEVENSEEITNTLELPLFLKSQEQRKNQNRVNAQTTNETKEQATEAKGVAQEIKQESKEQALEAKETALDAKAAAQDAKDQAADSKAAAQDAKDQAEEAKKGAGGGSGSGGGGK